MKILFCFATFPLLRNFDSVVRLLAERGHSLHLAADRQDILDGIRLVENLRKDCPSVEYSWAPSSKRRIWHALGLSLRMCLDYLRYILPQFKNAFKLRKRAERYAPSFIVRISKLPLLRSILGIRILSACIKIMERAVPLSSDVKQFIKSHKPDILLVSPLLYFGSPQVEYVRQAKKLGLRSVLCVGSWDHLTTKGLIHEVPDKVLVWNEMQKTEAVELHRVQPERIVVTGAQTYDHWFEWKPSRSREDFCRMVRLKPEKPFFLYLCSSLFIAPNEKEFIAEWLHQVKQNGSAQLRQAGILIRPHPQNVMQWENFDFTSFEDVRVWPQKGSNPIDAQSKADYYDSMYHSVAVVGVNTSALIESGIVGRKVYTLLSPEFAGTQEGTLHFHHLVKVSGGLLSVSKNFEEHLAQLSAALSEDGENRDQGQSFIKAFIRPHGIGVPATPFLVDEIEALGQMGKRRPQKSSIWVFPLRPFLFPLAIMAYVAFRLRKEKETSASATLGQWSHKIIQLFISWSRKRAKTLRKRKKRIISFSKRRLYFVGKKAKSFVSRSWKRAKKAWQFIQKITISFIRWQLLPRLFPKRYPANPQNLETSNKEWVKKD